MRFLQNMMLISIDILKEQFNCLKKAYKLYQYMDYLQVLKNVQELLYKQLINIVESPIKQKPALKIISLESILN
ncbi:unnamed protein product [Paramecium primaurelia]|uniref:Uncharacterized protein n=1 Tax=Paramecium primaurelia TaxID=5886 RepID=A0A8S1QCF4_PARPR|nr:unnamed protein product [Paramecium primaurelia]